MTATNKGKWRVTVENSSTMVMGAQGELIGPVTSTDEFDSLDAALKLACEKRKIRFYKVTVEGPHGVMDEEELARCCALANQK